MTLPSCRQVSRTTWASRANQKSRRMEFTEQCQIEKEEKQIKK